MKNYLVVLTIIGGTFVDVYTFAAESSLRAAEMALDTASRKYAVQADHFLHTTQEMA